MQVRLFAGVVIVSATVAGCGSSGSAAPAPTAPAVSASSTVDGTGPKLDAAFVARLQAICEPLAAEYTATPFPLSSFPTNPTAAQMRVIGAYFAKIDGAFVTAVNKIDALGQPAQDQVGWKQFTSFVHQVLATDQAEAKAGQAANEDAWSVAVAGARETADGLSGLLPNIGIVKNSSCDGAFG